MADDGICGPGKYYVPTTEYDKTVHKYCDPLFGDRDLGYCCLGDAPCVVEVSSEEEWEDWVDDEMACSRATAHNAAHKATHVQQMLVGVLSLPPLHPNINTGPWSGDDATALTSTMCSDPDRFYSQDYVAGHRCVPSSGGYGYCCGLCLPDNVYAANDGPGCTRLPDPYRGYCCPPPALSPAYVSSEKPGSKRGKRRREDDLADLLAYRMTLAKVPLTNKGARYTAVGTHFHEGPNPILDRNWRVLEVDATGDCFYDSLCRTYNSGLHPGQGPLDVTALRWRVARHVTPTNHRRFLDLFSQESDDYVTYSPDMSPDMLVTTMMTNHHLASRTDIRMIAEDPELNVIPIIINGNYGNKTMGKATSKRVGRIEETRSPIQHYNITPERLALPNRRYVLIKHTNVGSEHFRPLVYADPTAYSMTADQKARAAIGAGTQAFRAVYTEAELVELAPRILAEFKAAQQASWVPMP